MVERAPQTFRYRNRYFEKYTTPEILDKVCEFPFLKTDIIISTYQRSGTTFTQEIVWQIKNRKVTVKDEKVKSILERMAFLELDCSMIPDYPTDAFGMLKSQINDPYRYIKTHVPFDFIKTQFDKINPKMIVVMRNPKDCLVSNFHFELNIEMFDFKGTFDEYFQRFIQGELNTGSYFDNILEWWELRNRKNVLILFYEEILLNLPENVAKIASFLEEDLTTEEVNKIVHNCSFSTMSNNTNINIKLSDSFSFLRKGIVGDWKNHFTAEHDEIINDIIRKRFDPAGLKFIYE